LAARTPNSDDSKLTAEQKEARRAARTELKAAEKELRIAQRATIQARSKLLTPEQRKEYRERLKALDEARGATRKERAKEHRQALKEEIGTKKLTVQLRHEMRRHAWRVARLERISELAEAGEKPKLKERAEKLLEKESTLHKKRMTRYLAKVSQPGTQPSVSTSPTPAQPKAAVPAATAPAAPAAAAPASAAPAPAAMPSPNAPTKPAQPQGTQQ
ncbi:MAG: hypothetical protein MK135_10410, partial [Polyangiaceae bacterium]|nr:hypothetical protein [Polyangiaceae bacterium]